ncbi:MAG: amidase family protein, partial [Alphaproteobacteria bacterium]
MAELLDQPLSEIAAALRGGRLAAEAVAEAAIDRHHRLGAALNAYKAFEADRVLAQARAADAAFKTGRTSGALHGVPVSIKDLFGVGGFPT